MMFRGRGGMRGSIRGGRGGLRGGIATRGGLGECSSSGFGWTEPDEGINSSSYDFKDQFET